MSESPPPLRRPTNPGVAPAQPNTAQPGVPQAQPAQPRPAAPQAPAAPQPIEQFGDYQLLRKIGQGGMAEVFLAQSNNAPPGSPPIVIKRLHQDLEKNRDAVDLFLTEADVTLMLDHPNVIRVYDSGEVGNRYYMAMEYVHGKDLEQIWARFQQKNSVMPPDIAVHICIEMLRGLHYAHEAKAPSGRKLGIVHRDVTPSNIYISSSGHLKLGDFGVAKLIGMEGWTMAGSLKGKLGYLSPEQIAGQPPSPSIDLWASGIILWELLTGQRAFTGDNELDIMLRIKAAKVPKPRRVNRDITRPLQKILLKALHKRERKRYPDAAAFLEALDEYRGKHGRTYTEAELVQELTQLLS
ncbi:MAG: serine/threonine-protein kinase [Myxococcota bacterium]